MSSSPLLQQLKWSLQVLALPADLQIQKFPKFAVVTDELMLEFDNWSRAAAGAHSFSPAQKEALHHVDELFDQICGSDAEFCSSKESLGQHPRWEEVREAARRALSTFGWGPEIPPKDRSAYVPGRGARTSRAAMENQ